MTTRFPGLPFWLTIVALGLQEPPLEKPPFTSWAQLVLFVVALFAVVRWIWTFAKELRQKRNGGDGAAREITVAFARISTVLEQLDRTATLQGTHIAGLTTSLAALNATLTLLGERLANMPTKLDLVEGFERSRHDLRNAVSPIPTLVEETVLKALTDAETTLTRRRKP